PGIWQFIASLCQAGDFGRIDLRADPVTGRLAARSWGRPSRAWSLVPHLTRSRGKVNCRGCSGNADKG
ncbi:MAG: hypothetical protein ACK50P_13295, partial [Planctomycetaceae bacterium]